MFIGCGRSRIYVGLSFLLLIYIVSLLICTPLLKYIIDYDARGQFQILLQLIEIIHIQTTIFIHFCNILMSGVGLSTDAKHAHHEVTQSVGLL